MLKCYIRGIKTKMFKKIVSNLPFSPTLVEQVGLCVGRLRKEESARRLGLVFIALTLAIQILIVFQPSESANTTNKNDTVNGGVISLDEYLKAYDANVNNLKDVMDYAGITRSEIIATNYSSWKINEKISWGFLSHFSYADGERRQNIITKDNRLVTAYSRPLKLLFNTDYDAWGWVGYSQKIGWFAIMKDSGSLITNVAPETSTYLTSNIIQSVTAINSSKGFVDATSLIATAEDKISYTVSISNNGTSTSYNTKLEDNLSDILEYSTLVDTGGGTLNIDTKILSWPDVTLTPNSQQTKTFIVKILNPIPSTAKGKSNSTSFDCIATNTFGNSINIKIDCPTPKIIEQIITQLPTIGPNESLVFMSVLITIAIYFYIRTRQIKKELNIIKKDTISGIIQGI